MNKLSFHEPKLLREESLRSEAQTEKPGQSEQSSSIVQRVGAFYPQLPSEAPPKAFSGHKVKYGHSARASSAASASAAEIPILTSSSQQNPGLLFPGRAIRGFWNRDLTDTDRRLMASLREIFSKSPEAVKSDWIRWVENDTNKNILEILTYISKDKCMGTCSRGSIDFVLM